MYDYDVGALGLASPPTSAVMQQYRPAVQVRNNGIHDAIASGYLRIYSAGLLVFQSQVYSGTLAPGATGTADAVDYWTPEAEGAYIVQAYVSTPLDSHEPNNLLSPVTIIVSGEEPPPPPTVPLHAAQHEEGGKDPISIDGLEGRAADPQDALPHVASHQAGGTDQINVSSLIGELATAQTPKAHGNAYHDPNMATADQLNTHQNASSAHSAATNLANRATSGEEIGLVPRAQLAGQTSQVDGDLLLDWFHRWTVVVPTGLCCLWDGTNPTPGGWGPGGPAIPPPPPWIYIVKLPVAEP